MRQPPNTFEAGFETVVYFLDCKLGQAGWAFRASIATVLAAGAPATKVGKKEADSAVSYPSAITTRRSNPYLLSHLDAPNGYNPFISARSQLRGRWTHHRELGG